MGIKTDKYRVNTQRYVRNTDTAGYRDMLAMSTGLIGSIAAGHGLLEVVFYEMERWPSFLGIIFGFSLLLFAISGIPKLKTNISFPIIILTGVPALSFRIWTMNGVSGATAAWFVIPLLVAMIFGNKKQLVLSSMYSASIFMGTSFASTAFPFRNYSQYPETLGFVLSIYAFGVIGYHIFLVQKLHLEDLDALVIKYEKIPLNGRPALYNHQAEDQKNDGQGRTKISS